MPPRVRAVEHAEVWADLYRDGMSSTAIAGRYGFGHRTVLRVLRPLGVIRSISEAKRITSEAERRKVEIVAKYAATQSIDEISIETGIGRSSVYALLCRGGLGRTRRETRLLRTSQQNADYFDIIDSPEKAYWLGFVAADGCVSATPRQFRLTVELSRLDERHLRLFAAIFGRPLSFRSRTQQSGYVSDMASCRINSVHLVEALRRHWIRPRKAFMQEVARSFDSVPHELVSHFCRGYFDGDGSAFSTKGGGVGIDVSGRHTFIERYRDLLVEELGVNRVKVVSPIAGHGKARWDGVADVGVIANWFYASGDIHLGRKAKILTKGER